MQKGFEKVTRLEVIDEGGRLLVLYGVTIQVCLQDDARTCKVFIKTNEGDGREARFEAQAEEVLMGEV